MPKYLVKVKEVYVQSYLIEADTPDQAKQLAAEEGDILENSFEYSHTLDDEPSVEAYKD